MRASQATILFGPNRVKVVECETEEYFPWRIEIRDGWGMARALIYLWRAGLRPDHACQALCEVDEFRDMFASDRTLARSKKPKAGL
jgi:hypothetical protein